MLKKIFKILGYFCVGVVALIIILFFTKKGFSLYPFKYDFMASDLYFFTTLLILPFFRIHHNSWFKSDNSQIVTYKQKALDIHHQDRSQHHRGRRWSANGVSANPWEYTMSETATYGNAAGWGYSLFKSLVMSVLFVLFAPVFFIVLFFKCFSKR
ncbi:hypothetical protein ORR04_13450 (plasmid) [Levilactobacillus brevis]|uniref:DUF3899 domain-containing protein n=1 Tax=Levilactobacillus brevis TaxID=1580 RepID=A0AB38XA31_LEVBR|nr:hypothetical protein [Levilactobacillus brevis]WAD03131.1 hypothetical protein ORR04_13450 [Levilactobacillus brevis]